MFHKITFFLLAFCFFTSTIFSCEKCLEILQDRKLKFENAMKYFEEDSAPYAYFKGAAMGVESCISLYNFNHVDPGYMGKGNYATFTPEK